MFELEKAELELSRLIIPALIVCKAGGLQAICLIQRVFRT